MYLDYLISLNYEVDNILTKSVLMTEPFLGLITPENENQEKKMFLNNSKQNPNFKYKDLEFSSDKQIDILQKTMIPISQLSDLYEKKNIKSNKIT